MQTSMATGLEQGAVALLGSKSSQTLLKLTSHEEVVLLCCALIAVTSAVPNGIALVGRISSLMTQVFVTVALNTTLSAVVVPEDAGLTFINLIAVYLFGAALQQENASVSAQYMLVSNLSTALQVFKGEALSVAWTLALVPASLGVAQDVAGLAQMVAVESFTGWLKALLPRGALLPSTLVLLYLTAPFTTQFPLLARLYRFTVFAVSNDPQLHSVPSWMIATVLWALWMSDTDPVAKTFTAMAGANVAVLVALDYMQFAMDNDPAPVLVTLLVSIHIFERGHS